MRAARRGKFYESTGFVRVNLTAAVPQTPAIITVTSARPGEGKSTAVAAAAVSFALAGKRVLIIDLDLHRPAQHEFWSLGGRQWIPLPGATEGHQTSVVQALEHPETASAVDVGDGIYVLPAGEKGRRAESVLNDANFPVLIHRWAQGYDIVLIDTPPVLAVSDAFIVARHSNGLMLVVASDETSVPELQRVMRDAQSTDTKLLGIVLNKVRRNEQGYSYAYEYSSSN